VLINTHMLMAAKEVGQTSGRGLRFFYSSSACVYNADKQKSEDVIPLKEEDAYPAMPEDGYGWEKLYSERMCRHFREDFGMWTRVARYHNVYGPEGTWDGGREKAPAAICRKVIEAQLNGTGEIEIWGDGEQTRSFMYIDDCLEGMYRIMHSNLAMPLNLGRDEMVTINQLVDIVSGIAGKSLRKLHDTSKPQGVRGRNSDNSLLKQKLGWAPVVDLDTGLRPTYGRVSRHGAMALSWTMDKLGPMCRTAEDCGIVLNAIAGADALGLSSRDTVMPVVPMFHANAWSLAL
jgi:GDP-D-mannose 3', 5'-epimerase